MKTKLLATLVATMAAVAREPVVPTDRWSWRVASDPKIAPDGSRLVYLERWNDRSRNTTFANLWLLTTDGRTRSRFTDGQWRDYSPRWSPDGQRIAWISDRNGKPRIWIGRPGSGGAALESNELTPLALAWSPNGRQIAFTARVPAGGASPSWATPEIAALLRPPPPAFVQMFIVAAGGGDPRRLSTADLDYLGEPAWMPNGRDIVCAVRGGEIVAIRVADGAARQLTNSGADNREPTPSPDGSRIAFTSAAAKSHFYAVRQLWVMNADGSRARLLSGTLDRDVRHPQWSNESRTIYFIADDRGATHAYLARNDGTVRQLTSRPERLRGFSLADNGRAVTVRSSAIEGSAVFTFTTDAPAGGYTLVDPDQQYLAEHDLGPQESIEYGWIVKPPQFDASRKYPLLLDLEDAPPRMRGAEFSWRAQAFAARGFVVLLPNPHGTRGYGEEYGDLLPTQVPGDPADDALKAVDAAIAKGYVEPRRLILSGGTTAAWLLGHTGRFAAAVIRNAIVDWASYADAQRWLRVAPWEDAELYVKRSPIFYAGNIKTPTLVIGSDPQSAALFNALQRRNVRSAQVEPGDGIKGEIEVLQAELEWIQ